MAPFACPVLPPAGQLGQPFFSKDRTPFGDEPLPVFGVIVADPELLWRDVEDASLPVFGQPPPVVHRRDRHVSAVPDDVDYPGVGVDLIYLVQVLGVLGTLVPDYPASRAGHLLGEEVVDREPAEVPQVLVVAVRPQVPRQRVPNLQLPGDRKGAGEARDGPGVDGYLLPVVAASEETPLLSAGDLGVVAQAVAQPGSARAHLSGHEEHRVVIPRIDSLPPPGDGTGRRDGGARGPHGRLVGEHRPDQPVEPLVLQPVIAQVLDDAFEVHDEDYSGQHFSWSALQLDSTSAFLHSFGQNAVKPGVEFRAQAGDGRDLDPEVGAELGGEGVGRRVEQELWPLFRCGFLAPEPAVDVAGRVGYGEDQARQVRHHAGPEELVEDELVYVVASEIVEGAAFVGMDYDRAWLVDDPVPSLNHLLAPAQVLSEVRLPERELFPDRAAQAGAHVVEGGGAASLGRWQRQVLRMVLDLLLPPFESGDGQVADERTGHDAGVRPGDVPAVDRGDARIFPQVLDHSGQPPFVERHGVLDGQGHVLPG